MTQPRQSIKETARLAFTSELAITNHQTTDIYCQIGVAFEEISDTKDKDTCRKHHKRIQRLVAKVRLAHNTNNTFTKYKTKYRTHNQLNNDVLYYG